MEASSALFLKFYQNDQINTLLLHDKLTQNISRKRWLNITAQKA